MGVVWGLRWRRPAAMVWLRLGWLAFGWWWWSDTGGLIPGGGAFGLSHGRSAVVVRSIWILNPQREVSTLKAIVELIIHLNLLQF